MSTLYPFIIKNRSQLSTNIINLLIVCICFEAKLERDKILLEKTKETHIVFYVERPILLNQF